jgi:hypothetical protein
MQQQDIKKKKKYATSTLWRNFVIPSMEHYQKIIQMMDEEYAEKCPCCLKSDLIFLSDSGNIQRWVDWIRDTEVFGQQTSDFAVDDDTGDNDEGIE